LYDLKVQYKVDGIWVLYQKHSNQNYTVTQTHYVNDDKLAIPHDNAEKYLRDVLQERFDIKKLPPITKWQAEREKLTAVKKRLDVEYSKLRTETAAVEKIKRNIDDILNEGTGTPQRTKKHGIEL